MTLKEVLGRVKEIEEQAYDFEVAHGLEDRLHQDVLATIAADPKTPGNLARLAKAALQSQGIQFKRGTT